MNARNLSLAIGLAIASTYAALASAGTPNLTTNSGASSLEITDPYASSASSADAPWTKAMEPVTTLNSVSLTGRASGIGSSNTASKPTFDTFTPFLDNKKNMAKGTGSTTVGFGCDGINLGGVIDGQIGQYGSMVEGFISSAPTLAIMFLAYSQPTVKSVIDEMNNVSQFGLDMSNMTCGGVRSMADKSLEEKKQSMAEAKCTAEAGFKDPKCMSGDGITDSLVGIMRDTKESVNTRTQSLMKGAKSATGGFVSFTGGVGSAGAMSESGGAYIRGTESKGCTSVDIEGILGLIMAASEMNCQDIKNYAGLLPNYSSKDDVTGVIPRKMTLEDVSKKMTAQYYSWIQNALEAPESTFYQSEGFKALVNRIGFVITDAEHRNLNRLAKQQPTDFIAVHRNMATMAMLKDITGVVNRLEVGVMTGIQNQPDSELIAQRQIEQYRFAIATLRSELKAINDQIEVDRQRAKLTKE